MTTPGGLRYQPGFLPPEDQEFLLQRLRELRFDQWQQIRFRGQLARRRKVAYGWNYEPSDRELTRAPPMPEYLHRFRDRCAEELGMAPAKLAAATLTYYPPGAGIGRHKDAPYFGNEVAGLSLGTAARIIFRRGDRKATLTLEPGSLLLLTGDAREKWTHEMPGVAGDRYSIYFRSLREPAD